jgi:hypothetical protein
MPSEEGYDALERTIFDIIATELAKKYPPDEYEVTYLFSSDGKSHISARMNVKAMEKYYPELMEGAVYG